LNKTNSNFKSELKFYITQICTKLAKILYSKGLYKNALYWIDFATKNYLPQDPQFTKLLQLKSYIVAKKKESDKSKKRPFAIPEKVQKRPNKKAKIS
jgi:hypothetical protein